MRPRYARALPVVVAIVVAAVVTTVLAVWVLPAGDDSGLAPADAIADAERLTTPTATAAIDTATATAVPPTTAPPTAPTPTVAATLTPPPSPTPAPTRPPSTPTPSPTRTPVVGDNLVANGGFSDGLNAWYVEGEVQIVVDGGRRGGPGIVLGTYGYVDQRIAAAPGRTYRLAAWGGVSVAGERAEVGILFLDAAENRLTIDDPPRLVFDDNEPERQTLAFSPPADARTVQVYLWNSSGVAALVVDDVSVREFVVPVTPTPAGPAT